MKATDKDIIKEDLYFIMSYMTQIEELNPSLLASDTNKELIRKIERRISDISIRVES